MFSFAALLSIIKHPRFLVPLGFTLGGFFVYLTMRGIDWSEVRAQLAETELLAVAGAVAIMMFSSFLRAYRWRLMWTSERVTTWRLFSVEMAALGLNNFAPVRLMDEPAVLTMLTLRDRHPAPTVVATVVMTRVQDIMFTMVFAASAIVFEPQIARLAGPAIYLSGILIVFFILLLNLGRIAAAVHSAGKDTRPAHLRADGERGDAEEKRSGRHRNAHHHLLAHARAGGVGAGAGDGSRDIDLPGDDRHARLHILPRRHCRGCQAPSGRSSSRS